MNSDHGIEPQEVRGYTLELTEDLDSDPGKLKVYASDFRTLEARMTGRSHDLDGAHNDAAQSFTELFKWPIIAESGIDLEHWSETTRAILICSALTNELADAIEHYKDERAKIISRWNTEAPNVNDIDVPNQLDDLGLQDPLEDLPTAPTENEALVNLKEELEEEERVLKSTSVDVIDEITDGIRNGESPEVLTRLHEGGYINYGYFNHGGDLEEGVPFDVDHEELPENVMEYVDGDKEPDDEFYEMVAYLSQIGFKAMGAQNFDDVNIDPEDMQLLKDLFDHIEEEGDLMGVPEDVQGHMSPEDSAALLAALGGGLLTLSDKRLTNGREDIPGGYYALPESFREAAENGLQHDLSKNAWEEMEGILENAPQELQPGRGLSLTLNMSIGQYFDVHDWDPKDLDPGDPRHNSLHPPMNDNDEERIRSILDVTFRNESANADMLAGLPDWFPDTDWHPDSEGSEQARKDTLASFFSHDWDDEGETIGNLTNWMHEHAPDVPNSDDGDDVITEQERLAAHAMEGFMDLMRDEDFYRSISNTEQSMDDPNDPDNPWRNVSATQLNPELSDAWADLFIGYLENFGSTANIGGASSPGLGWNEEDNILYLDKESRMNFSQLLMGEQSAAEKVYSEVMLYTADSMEDFLWNVDASESGDRNREDFGMATGAGVLRGLLDEALERESEKRDDLHKQGVEYEDQVRGQAVDVAGGALADLGAPSTAVEIFKILAKGDSEDDKEKESSVEDIENLMLNIQLRQYLLTELAENDESALEELNETWPEIVAREEDEDGNEQPMGIESDRSKWDTTYEDIDPVLLSAFSGMSSDELAGRDLESIRGSYEEAWKDYYDAW